MVCVGNPIRHVMFCTANSACIFSWTSLVITSKVENITYLSIRSTFQKKHVLPIRRKGFDHNLKRIHSLSSNHGGISLQKVLDFYPRLRSVQPSLVAANYGHFGLLIFRTILGTNDHMRVWHTLHFKGCEIYSEHLSICLNRITMTRTITPILR